MSNDNCPICDSALSSDKCKTVPYPSNNLSNDVPKRIIFCENCGLGVADPMPSDDALERFYCDSNYWSKTEPVVSPRKQPIFPTLARSRWSLIQTHLNRLKKKPGGLKILDVGAGFGYLGIVAANVAGVVLDEYGAVEPDPKVRSALEKAWPDQGNNSKLNTFPELGQVEKEYDIIALSHVLEHVKDPLRMISTVLSCISDDGLLFIDVPNRDDLYKPDVFPHLLFFSPENLKLLMEQVDLTIIDLDTWGNPREKSPLNRCASVTMKITTKLIGRLTRFAPAGFSIFMLSELYQVNARHGRGTWIRLLACNAG